MSGKNARAPKSAYPSPRQRALVAFAMVLFGRDSACYGGEGPFDLIFPKQGDEAFDQRIRSLLSSTMESDSPLSACLIDSLSPSHRWLVRLHAEWERDPLPAPFAVTALGEPPAALFADALREGVLDAAWAKSRLEESGWSGSALAAIEAHELGKSVPEREMPSTGAARI